MLFRRLPLSTASLSFLYHPSACMYLDHNPLKAILRICGSDHMLWCSYYKTLRYEDKADGAVPTSFTVNHYFYRRYPTLWSGLRHLATSAARSSTVVYGMIIEPGSNDCLTGSFTCMRRGSQAQFSLVPKQGLSPVCRSPPRGSDI
jgi:hypothetical protein